MGRGHRRPPKTGDGTASGSRSPTDNGSSVESQLQEGDVVEAARQVTFAGVRSALIAPSTSHVSRFLSEHYTVPPKMADPFEVRMRFTSQLQHLNASVTSAQKAAQFALKYRDMGEDLHSCILEQLERVSLQSCFLLPCFW